MNITGKKITVIGLGESGKAAAMLLKAKGALVYVTDSGNSPAVISAANELRSLGINVETGAHSREFITGSKLMVISPGVPCDSLALKWAQKERTEIIGEIELASYFCKGKIIAVTGTNGKSTTVTLISEILKNSGRKTVLCGNVGNAFCGEIDKIDKDTFVVLEVSSFQLEYIRTFRPFICAILNISQNHLDRHKDFQEYLCAKRKIYMNQTEQDYCLLNYDDEYLGSIKTETINADLYYFSVHDSAQAAYTSDEKLYVNINAPQFISSIKDLRLKQPHNIENFLVSSLCAVLCGASPEVIRDTIINFEGLKHRTQLVAAINGVDFIDDSKATTVDATRAALRSIPKKIVLIAGGRNKGSDFRPLKNEIAQRVKALVLIGEARHQMREAFFGLPNIAEAATMEEAVKVAAEIAQAGEAVLLSPMCASFDMFKSYKDRGEAFISAVNKLKLKP